MALRIEDGGGTGRQVQVTDEFQLKVVSENHELQHHESLTNGEAYQVIGDFAAVNNSTHAVLHLKNDDTTKLLVVSFIRVQLLNVSGGTALPDPGNRFEIGFGRTVSSGGTAVTPVNMNTTSGNTASVTATDNNPTMAGTFTEFDRWYPDSGESMMTFNKQGSLILGQDDTLEVRVVSDHTAGTAYARVTFMMI